MQRPGNGVGVQVGCQHQESETAGYQGHGGLGNHDQLPAVHPVGQDSSPRPDQQDWQRPYPNNRAGKKRIAPGEVEHQPADGEHLQPLDALGSEVARPDKAEVPVMFQDFQAGFGSPTVGGGGRRYGWSVGHLCAGVSGIREVIVKVLCGVVQSAGIDGIVGGMGTALCSRPRLVAVW